MPGLKGTRQAFQGLILFKNYTRTWSFPREIERIIMDETSDGSAARRTGLATKIIIGGIVESEKFESWAIVEIFGHTQIAGKVSEASIGGCSFIRVDVPECEGKAAFTKFFGNGAIYSMTPCGEDIALAAVKSIRHAPINVYIPAQKSLPVGDDDRCDQCGDYNADCRC